MAKPWQHGSCRLKHCRRSPDSPSRGGKLSSSRPSENKGRGSTWISHRWWETPPRPPAPAPAVAVIGLAGGRVRTRASGQGTGVHGLGWQEDKVACLQTLKGTPFSAAPHPAPPRCFLDAPQGEELVRDRQAHPGT